MCEHLHFEGLRISEILNDCVYVRVWCMCLYTCVYGVCHGVRV